LDVEPGGGKSTRRRIFFPAAVAQLKSAMAVSNGFFAGELDVVVNVNVTYSGPDCPDSFAKRTTRVLTYDVSVPGPADRGFTVDMGFADVMVW
jgi:hypothetical protein